MGDNQKYTTIKIRPLCTACGNDCGEHLITVGENIILCFTCIEKAKEKVDLYRKEIAEKEIQQMAKDLSTSDIGLVDVGMATARSHAERLYKAGYRKVE
ncbi:hypothetical protein [Proteus mirabilis]|uniref:hypothetical protein n=1 Tax=Proteus mirabilis TaxID=584 RepID=UPI002553216C|nr:hypothetical protein [Proteus mirabilis]MDL2100820.1 hypothetical protein [Proteus mirabilis]HEK0772650.1 hypothetical protein [Proteus mirabilis]HEK2735766.1 hypothetical protein [Proteus mirabilis]